MASASTDFSYTATDVPGQAPDGLDQSGKSVSVWTVTLTPGIDGNQSGANGSGVYFGETFDSFANGWEEYSFQGTGAGQGGSVDSVNTFSGGFWPSASPCRSTLICGAPIPRPADFRLAGWASIVEWFRIHRLLHLRLVATFSHRPSTTASAGAMQYQYQSPFNIQFTVTSANTYSAVAGSDAWSGTFSGSLTGHRRIRSCGRQQQRCWV